MFSDSCEMAYGEQAALRGLLATLRPKVALEIGTYTGGSLEILAEYCSVVHTFDLADHVEEHLPDVHYHVGDSSHLVPKVLEGIANDGGSVEFILIDGDHSRMGVRKDLENVLVSTAVRRTVIVLHDVANEAVRAGIRDAALDRPEIAYANLSFVPTWERVHPLEESWGGLGLLVVDAVGDLWVSRRRLDANVAWPTVVPRSIAWRAAAPLRASRRWALYHMRPVVRTMRGSRGIKLG